MRALSLLVSFLARWAGTAMLLSRLPWFRDSVSLAERLAPYAPNVEPKRRVLIRFDYPPIRGRGLGPGVGC